MFTAVVWRPRRTANLSMIAPTFQTYARIFGAGFYATGFQNSRSRISRLSSTLLIGRGNESHWLVQNLLRSGDVGKPLSQHLQCHLGWQAR